MESERTTPHGSGIETIKKAIQVHSGTAYGKFLKSRIVATSNPSGSDAFYDAVRYRNAG